MSLLGPKGNRGDFEVVKTLKRLEYKGITFETRISPSAMEFFESENITKEELLMLKMCDKPAYDSIKINWKAAWLLQQADWAFEEDEYQ